MDNSFFEYRNNNNTGVDKDSESDSEFIDGSIIEDVIYSTKKKNHTVFVAESDESTSNDESMRDEFKIKNASKSVVRRTNAAEAPLVSSSEDDGSRRGSIWRLSGTLNNVVVTSDEDEEELSPELVPKRRPPPPKKSIDSDEPLILRKTKKRMLFLDSDTDNSIILDHNKNKKLACLKETPLKIDNKKTDENESMVYDQENGDGDDDRSDDESELQCNTEISSKYKKMVINSDDSTDDEEEPSKDNNADSKNNSHENDESSKMDDDQIDVGQQTKDDVSGEEFYDDDDDDGPDEDMMLMSRATRMSIMGVIPKDNDSDESDFIQSDVSSQKSKDSIAGSFENLSEASHKNVDKSIESDDDLPEITLHSTPDKTIEPDNTIKETPEKSMGSGSPSIQNTPQKSTELTGKVQGKVKENAQETSIESDDELPEVTIHKTPNKTVESESNDNLPEESVHTDDSRISCSPFSSPLHDLTNDINNVPSKNNASISRNIPKATNTSPKKGDFMDLTVNTFDTKPKDLRNAGVIDLSNIAPNGAKNWFSNESASVLMRRGNDDDVTIIDKTTEIIALSSDDEDDEESEKSPKLPSPKAPRVKKSPKPDEDSKPKTGIKQYLVPASYPDQVVYVKKHVRENELDKLMRLREDLDGVKHLLEEMDLDSLPDGGSRLVQRYESLEQQVRQQGDKVANMVVEPDQPTAADIAKDGFDKGLSWEDIQKASNAVQPRMFGKQAMATHMAERNLILERLRDLHASLASRPAERAQAPAPRALRSRLMPHQLQALAWLQWRETQRPRAGILADDMGLGKTITMIALVASDKQDQIDLDEDDDEGTGRGKMVRGGTLVVCPASLIQQWAEEVSKHCAPHAISVCLHHGAARAKEPHRLATYDMVATTYNILQRDKEKNGVLMRIQWRRVILDEAHIVRNHKAATSAAVCRLRAARRWGLTGTPVQNKDLDLFALLKFLRCSPFDDLQMWKKWIDNKSLGGQERLSTVMRCILLRRTKVQLQQLGQLACLPSRTPHLTLVTLEKDEMNVYQKVLVLSKTLFGQFLHQRAEKNSDAVSVRSKGQDSEYAKMHKKMVALQGVKPVKSHEILVLLLRLRQVCCHCGLIAGMLDEAGTDMPEDMASADLLRELDKLSLEDEDRRQSVNPEQEEENPAGEESAKADEAIRAVLSPNNPVFQLKRPSSKIAAVMKCLTENVFANTGHKAVVVSQWTSVLRLVEHELNLRHIRSVTLSGAVPVPARPHLIRAVNDPASDVRVMLLSLCAGGVGINLCGANHLLLLDPHWNPQLEEQAQDRIYRVGQARDVHIYRFLCVDTVEQKIRKLQESKLELAENVLTGARNTAASTLSIEDLKMLFNMGK